MEKLQEENTTLQECLAASAKEVEGVKEAIAESKKQHAARTTQLLKEVANLRQVETMFDLSPTSKCSVNHVSEWQSPYLDPNLTYRQTFRPLNACIFTPLLLS